MDKLFLTRPDPQSSTGARPQSVSGVATPEERRDLPPSRRSAASLLAGQILATRLGAADSGFHYGFAHSAG